MKLYGKNPILERVKANPGSIKKLFLQKKVDLSDIVKECKKAGLDFESVEKEDIAKLAGGVHSQGVVAEINDYEYTKFPTILAECVKSEKVIVFLDNITDPQNFGGIIRSLACLGNFSLVIPEHDSAEVNETVLRVANGGENYVKIAKVTNIATTIKKIREKGIWVAGATIEDAVDITKAELKRPLAIVIGAEGKGIRHGVLKCLDEKVALSMDGAKLSFNAAVAAALVCYEVSKKGKG